MICNIQKPPLNELTHFGVLGMKWGKRKKQESASVTKARALVAKEKLNYKAVFKSELNSDINMQKSKKQLIAENNYRYSKEDLAKSIILDRLKSKDKSKKQISLEAKYKQKGMSDDEAAVAAYQNLKTKKILAIVGGITVTAAAGYAAYKIHDYNTDKLIKSGSLLQNVSTDSNQGVRDAFYASTNKVDNFTYQGLYGAQLHRANGASFQKQIKTLSDIKQVSTKNATTIFKEMMTNDKDFSNLVTNNIKTRGAALSPTYAGKVANAKGSLSKGIIDKNVYEVFNALLVDHTSETQAATNKFYSKLSEKGYNAVKDINDSKYSGFGALNPIIAFNTKGKVEVMKVDKLVEKQIYAKEAIKYTHIIGSSLVKQGAQVAAVVLGVKSVKKMNYNKAAKKKTDEYKKDHPGTKLTNTEIIRMLERSQVNEH